jgi:serine/threonine protein kinase
MRACAKATVERDQDRPGTELVPGYRLVARVGSGGAGDVWSAEAPGGLRVALKIVRLTGGLGRREMANVRILRAIRHPNLLAYFGAWQHRDRLIVGMELADGSLWDRLAEARYLGLAGIPLGELLEIIGEVARVIDFLNEPCHELEGRSGVAIHHRDIKPQNIMLIGRGVKVADFGLSCLDNPSGASKSQCGLTFAYAAPETFRRRVSASSDQYSLAVTYCQLRGGRLPFVGPPAAVMMGHLFGDPDLSMLPGPERPIIARAMAKDVTERWPDCRSLVKALVGCAEAGAPESLPGGPELPEGSFESSSSVEIPPLPVAYDGTASAASDVATGPLGGTDVSAYCLEWPGTQESGANAGVGASASPTVVRTELSALRAHPSVSRLGIAAATIVAVGLALWSWSERVAIRAALPAVESPAQSTSPPTRAEPGRIAGLPTLERGDDPRVLAYLGRLDTRSSTRRTEPAPAPSSRSVTSRLHSVGTGHRGRTLADSTRALIATRSADFWAWEQRVREASATARTWLASITNVRRTSTAPLPLPSLQGLLPASPRELSLGLPELLDIEAGRSISIPIRVNRAGHTESLSIHFEGLPTGVTIPDVTIPAGQDQARVVALARLDAPATTARVVIAIRAGSARVDAQLRVRANPAMLDRTRGHTLLACGRHTEAVAAFTEAIRAGVTDACVYHNRGLAYSSLNHLDQAILDYTEAIRLRPTDATIRYDRGMAFARRGDDLRALLDLDTAIRLNPSYICAYQARARIYQKHGDLARSCADGGRASDLARAARPDGHPPVPRPPQATGSAGPDRQVPFDHPTALSH